MPELGTVNYKINQTRQKAAKTTPATVGLKKTKQKFLASEIHSQG